MHVLEQAARWARCQPAAHPELPIWERLRAWDTADLPLATDLLIYSRQEWESLPAWNPKLAATLAHDLRWLIAPDELGI